MNMCVRYAVFQGFGSNNVKSHITFNSKLAYYMTYTLLKESTCEFKNSLMNQK